MAATGTDAGEVRNGSNGGGGRSGAMNGAMVFDERDGFISWLQSEFAAANAIIDLLLGHLLHSGDPGEYDGVAACLHQRRYHWTQLIHMQQYFPITEVQFALHQIMLHRHQQQQQFMPQSAPASPQRRHGYRNWQHQQHRTNGSRDYYLPAAAIRSDGREKGDDNETKGGNSNGGDSSSHEHEDPQEVFGTADNDGSKEPLSSFKAYVSNELFDGKMVNIVEGLKLYEDIIDQKELQSFLSWANDTRTVGRKGELLGQTTVGVKRPMKGHGREVFQFGVPIIDGLSEDEYNAVISSDRKVEPLPSLIVDFSKRLVQHAILPLEPDYCVIDFFNEGDFSHPHFWPYWYGQPVCTLFLTSCNMVFGRSFALDNRGDHRTQLKLSFEAGSLLVLHGKSVDLAKHAIPSVPKQRILLTFGKSQPRKITYADSSRLSSTPPIPWSRSSGRPTNVGHCSPSPKSFLYVTGNGALPVPPASLHNQPPADGIRPVFVASTPVAPRAVYSSSAPLTNPPVGNMEVASKSSAPRSPAPGTGVFLPPPGADNPPQVHDTVSPLALAELGSSEAALTLEKKIDVGTENGHASLHRNENEGGTDLECNGTATACHGIASSAEEVDAVEVQQITIR